MKKLIPLILLALLISSCSNNQKKNVTEASIAEEQIAEAETQQKIPPAILENGEDVYKKHCLACHQTDGSGNPGMYPPLDNTKMVNGDKEELIKIILNGLSG
ncbi:MAG: c-type cytochrome, partial [Bacteroidales bacterium]